MIRFACGVVIGVAFVLTLWFSAARVDEGQWEIGESVRVSRDPPDAIVPGTAREDSIWIRNWGEEGRMQFPDGDGGFREPLGEIDRLAAEVDSLKAAASISTPVPTVPDTMWFADADSNQDIVLHVIGAELAVPLIFDFDDPGSPDLTRIDATLRGELYWTKGEWVFRGQGAK